MNEISTTAGRPRRLTPQNALVALLLCLGLVAPLRASDRVVRGDGHEVRGHVVSLDENVVIVQTAGGTVRLPRAEVVRIELNDDESSAPPLKVEIRNVRTDDSLDVLLHEEPVIVGARQGGEWTDVTDKLNTGNNPLRLRIRNERGAWAYQINIRINGVVTRLACGTPSRPDDPCKCCGKNGRELGVIDDLPTIWIYADLERGEAEVVER